MHNAIINDASQAPSTTNPARFDGLRKRLIAASQATSLSGYAPTKSDIDTVVRSMRDKGMAPNFVHCSTYVGSTFDSWGGSNIVRNLEPGEPGYVTFGSQTRKLTIGGAEMYIFQDPDRSYNSIVGDSTKMSFGPMSGMELRYEPMAKTGSNKKGLIQGQYVFRCPGPSAWLLYNVKSA